MRGNVASVHPRRKDQRHEHKPMLDTSLRCPKKHAGTRAALLVVAGTVLLWILAGMAMYQTTGNAWLVLDMTLGSNVLADSAAKLFKP